MQPSLALRRRPLSPRRLELLWRGIRERIAARRRRPWATAGVMVELLGGLLRR